MQQKLHTFSDNDFRMVDPSKLPRQLASHVQFLSLFWASYFLCNSPVIHFGSFRAFFESAFHVPLRLYMLHGIHNNSLIVSYSIVTTCAWFHICVAKRDRFVVRTRHGSFVCGTVTSMSLFVFLFFVVLQGLLCKTCCLPFLSP